MNNLNTNTMDAIIMCAGRGTRLRPITDTIPKPLVPVNGKGSLEHTLEALPSEVSRVILIVGYLSDKIKERIGDAYRGKPVVYVTQNPLDGTGGCLRQVKEQIPDLSERFLVLYGDDIYDRRDLAELVAVPRGLLAEEYVAAADDTKDAWKIDSEGRLLELYRPKAGDRVYMNIGAYVLDHHWFETDPIKVPGKADEWSLPHAIPQMIKAGNDVVAVNATLWLPVNTPEDLTIAEEVMRSRVTA
jgi:bifunctional UDP-N-acetylglucosamine pyrophosphorylase/glucosamine-1-phosphate N-acetyltransferase